MEFEDSDNSSIENLGFSLVVNRPRILESESDNGHTEEQLRYEPHDEVMFQQSRSSGEERNMRYSINNIGSESGESDGEIDHRALTRRILKNIGSELQGRVPHKLKDDDSQDDGFDSDSDNMRSSPSNGRRIVEESEEDVSDLEGNGIDSKKCDVDDYSDVKWESDSDNMRTSPTINVRRVHEESEDSDLQGHEVKVNSDHQGSDSVKGYTRKKWNPRAYDTDSEEEGMISGSSSVKIRRLDDSDDEGLSSDDLERENDRSNVRAFFDKMASEDFDSEDESDDDM